MQQTYSQHLPTRSDGFSHFQKLTIRPKIKWTCSWDHPDHPGVWYSEGEATQPGWQRNLVWHEGPDFAVEVVPTATSLDDFTAHGGWVAGIITFKMVYLALGMWPHVTTVVRSRTFGSVSFDTMSLTSSNLAISFKELFLLVVGGLVTLKVNFTSSHWALSFDFAQDWKNMSWNLESLK